MSDEFFEKGDCYFVPFAFNSNAYRSGVIVRCVATPRFDGVVQYGAKFVLVYPESSDPAFRKSDVFTSGSIDLLGDSEEGFSSSCGFAGGVVDTRNLVSPNGRGGFRGFWLDKSGIAHRIPRRKKG